MIWHLRKIQLAVPASSAALNRNVTDNGAKASTKPTIEPSIQRSEQQRLLLEQMTMTGTGMTAFASTADKFAFGHVLREISDRLNRRGAARPQSVTRPKSVHHIIS